MYNIYTYHLLYILNSIENGSLGFFKLDYWKMLILQWIAYAFKIKYKPGNPFDMFLEK